MWQVLPSPPASTSRAAHPGRNRPHFDTLCTCPDVSPLRQSSSARARPVMRDAGFDRLLQRELRSYRRP